MRLLLTKCTLRLTYRQDIYVISDICEISDALCPSARPPKPIRLMRVMLRFHRPQLSVKQNNEVTYSSSTV